jgi:lysozyme
MAKTLEYIYGKKPIIYTSMGFYNEYLSPTFDNYPLMIARYSSKRPVLNGNTGYTIWQYSENGRVKGINGTVDLSRFSTNRSLKSIKRK